MEKDEDSAFKYRERCSWSKGSSANLSIQLRAGWIGKFCVNWETGESQRRRRIPKLAASGQILQIGGNGEAPRRVAGENARSCPRLTLCPGQLLPYKSYGANQSPCWGKFIPGCRGSQKIRDNQDEGVGQIVKQIF